MRGDTKYLRRELRGWNDPRYSLSLRGWVRVVAAGPSGGKLHRVALAWLTRKCPKCGRAAARESAAHDASLARKAAVL